MKFHSEKGNFLNEKQKAVKQEIMENLINAMIGTFEKNIHLFDNQESTDLLNSCLIMFNREMIVGFLRCSTIPNNIEAQTGLIDAILYAIKQSIIQKLEKENKGAH